MIISQTIVNSSPISEVKLTRAESFEEICTGAPQTLECHEEAQINRIEMDCHDDSQSVEELIPYPYIQSSQELQDYHHLELSLGEDWSFRLAGELSCDDISIDCDSIAYDSSFHSNDCCDFDLEDMEVCAYNRGSFFDNIEIPGEARTL